LSRKNVSSSAPLMPGRHANATNAEAIAVLIGRDSYGNNINQPRFHCLPHVAGCNSWGKIARLQIGPGL
jgi:hypothetical protein